MRALVFGGSGFIGKKVVEKLLSEGVRVRIFDRIPVNQLSSYCEQVVGDFLDQGLLLEALIGVDVVYHCISTTLPSTSNIDPLFDVESNLVGSIQLMQGMKKCGVKRIIFLSSGGTVYGDADKMPLSEDHPIAPLCSYGIVKHAIEKYLLMYQFTGDIDPLIIRASNPYGEGQLHLGVQGVLITFLRRILADEELVIWGDGSVARDYIYIDDLVAFTVLAGQSIKTGVYNIGSGLAVSINILIAQIEHVTGCKARVQYQEKRHFDVQVNCLDIKKAFLDFGWRPKISLEEGLRKCAERLIVATGEKSISQPAYMTE